MPCRARWHRCPLAVPANAVRYDANNEFSQSEQNGNGQDAKTMGDTLRKLFFSRTSSPGTALLRCVPNPTEPRP